jgi:hypothetical protein
MNASSVSYISLKRQEPTRLSQSQSPNPLCADINTELANTTNSIQGITKRGIIVQARAASPSILGAIAHFLIVDAPCASKPARWRCRDFFTKERMRHDIPEEPTRRDRTRVSFLCLDGPTKKYGCITPRTKSARSRNKRKTWQHFEHL